MIVIVSSSHYPDDERVYQKQICSLKTIFIIVCSMVLIGILSKLIKTQISFKRSPKDNKIVLYYTKKCGFSQQQLKLISNSNLTDHFNLVDCEEFSNKCENVNSVPQFLTPSGKIIVGLQSVNKLQNMVNEL